MARDDLAELLGVGQPPPYTQIVANDPYTGFGDLFQGIGKQVASPAAQEYPTKDRIIAGLLSGLLSGGFEGASQDYQSRATDAYKDVVLKAAQGVPVERPDVLSPSVFTTAQENASLFRNKLAEDQGNYTSITPEESQILAQYDPNFSKIRDPRILDRVLRAKQLSGVQERSDRAYEAVESERSIPGLKRIEGYRPTQKDQDESVDIIGNRNLIKANLSDLKASLKAKGQTLTGADSIDQLQSIAELLRLQKERFGGGAAYTELEAKLANAVLPKIIADPTVSLASVLKNAGLGRDPLDAISNLERLIEREAKFKLQARKFTIDDSIEEDVTIPTPSVSSSISKEAALAELKRRGVIP